MNAFERTLRSVDAYQQRHVILSLPVALVKKFGDDNAGSLVVQLTYSMFITVFPLLLLLVTILSLVVSNDPSMRAHVLDSAFGQFPVIGDQLAHNIHAMRRGSPFGMAVGIGGLIYGSMGLAQAGMYAMEQVWNIPSAVRPNLRVRVARGLIFLIVLGIGLVVTTALAGFGTFGRHNFMLGLLGEVLAAVVNIGIYLALFRVLTPRQVCTRALVPGTVVAGIEWTILQALGGYVVGHDLKGASALYGIFGLVLGLAAWIYLGAKIMVYAAELNSVLHHHLWPRGLIQPPLTDADQRSLALQVTQSRRRPDQEVTTRFPHRPMTEDEFRRRGYRPAEIEPVETEPDECRPPETTLGIESSMSLDARLEDRQ